MENHIKYEGALTSSSETNKRNKKMLTQNFFHAIINNRKLSFLFDSDNLWDFFSFCCDFDRSQKGWQIIYFYDFDEFQTSRVSIAKGMNFNKIHSAHVKGLNSLFDV